MLQHHSSASIFAAIIGLATVVSCQDNILDDCYWNTSFADTMYGYTIQTTYDLILNIGDGNVEGSVMDTCPLNSTVSRNVTLTCVDLMLGDSLEFSSLLICYSELPDGAVLQLTNDTGDSTMVATTARPVAMSSSTGQPSIPNNGTGQEKCDDVSDWFKYGLIAGLGASGLLNIIFLICIAYLCRKNRRDRVIVSPQPVQSKARDTRETADYVVKNRTPGSGWDSKSEAIVQAPDDHWCETPTATLNHSVRPRRGTFEGVESSKVKERMPLRDDLYVHRPKPGEEGDRGLEYSTAVDRYALSPGGQHQTFIYDKADVEAINGGKQSAATAEAALSHSSRDRVSSSGRFFLDSESDVRDDNVPRPTDLKSPEEEAFELSKRPQNNYQGLEPRDRVVSNGDADHGYEPLRLADLTPRTDVPKQSLLSGAASADKRSSQISYL